MWPDFDATAQSSPNSGQKRGVAFVRERTKPRRHVE